MTTDLQPGTRDFVGYGPTPPDPAWPGGKRLALNFVVNYEEGAERSVADGDDRSEVLNSDNVSAAGRIGQRDLVTESLYEYGARAGYWRLMRLFESRGVEVSAFVVGQALERNPEVAVHLAGSGHEVCCHGWRWIDYADVPEAVEAEHMSRALEAVRRTGKPVTGWYTGRVSPQTRRLAAAQAGLRYDSDAYDDDLPHWVEQSGEPWLVVPYTFDCNDMRFASSPGFNSPDQFVDHLRRSFDMLLEEGKTSPRMMSVGLHCRLTGRPARAHALAEFVDYALGHDDVWICRRNQIAEHWYARHPAHTALIGQSGC